MNNNEVYFSSAYLEGLSSTGQPPSQDIIDAMNKLWFMTEGLGNSGGNLNSSLNLTMLAQTISQLVAQTPNLYDSATISIMAALTGGANPPAAGSPAALAAAYLSDPTSPTAEGAFMASMQGLENSGFSGQVNSWWGAEFGGISPPSHVTIKQNEPLYENEPDVKNLMSDLQAYLQNSSAVNLQTLMGDISKVNGLMAGGNLDPYSQMLFNLLNTPLNPNDPNSSLAALANSSTGNANELGYYLLEGGFGSVLANQINLMSEKEWPPA